MQRDRNENLASIIVKRPHVTEKATSGRERGVYTFIVHSSANKREIIQAIQELYHVTPRKVRVSNVPEKIVFSRAKRGVKSGYKKAFVYVRKGDSIEIA